MGRQTSGIFGDWKGRVGNLVGSSVYGTATIKTYKEHINDKKSASQISQRSAFKAAMYFGVQINSAICIPLLKRWAKNMSAINKFVSLNTGAFTSAGALIPANLVISQGKMMKASYTIPSSSINECEIDAVPVSDPFALPTDNVYVMATDGTFDEKGNPVILFQKKLEITRSVFESASPYNLVFDTPASADIHIYVSYLRADGSMVSDSSYKCVAI